MGEVFFFDLINDVKQDENYVTWHEASGGKFYLVKGYSVVAVMKPKAKWDFYSSLPFLKDNIYHH